MGRLVPISYDEERNEPSEKNRCHGCKANSDFDPRGQPGIWRLFVACSIWIDTGRQRRIKDGRLGWRRHSHGRCRPQCKRLLLYRGHPRCPGCFLAATWILFTKQTREVAFVRPFAGRPRITNVAVTYTARLDKLRSCVDVEGGEDAGKTYLEQVLMTQLTLAVLVLARHQPAKPQGTLYGPRHCSPGCPRRRAGHRSSRAGATSDRPRRPCLKRARTRVRLSHPWATVPLRTAADSRQHRPPRRRPRSRGNPRLFLRSGRRRLPWVARSESDMLRWIRVKRGQPGGAEAEWKRRE